MGLSTTRLIPQSHAFIQCFHLCINTFSPHTQSNPDGCMRGREGYVSCIHMDCRSWGLIGCGCRVWELTYIPSSILFHLMNSGYSQGEHPNFRGWSFLWSNSANHLTTVVPYASTFFIEFPYLKNSTHPSI